MLESATWAAPLADVWRRRIAPPTLFREADCQPIEGGTDVFGGIYAQVHQAVFQLKTVPFSKPQAQFAEQPPQPPNPTIFNVHCR